MGSLLRRSALARVVVLALTLAGTGCATSGTDVATLSRSGRHEVALAGAGVTLGGSLFRPSVTDRPVPAIIVLHGWAEAGIPGAPRVERAARRLAEEGYVALALSLRGWPNSGGRDDCGLEQPSDVQKAADWLASLPGVDPDRIGVLGFSQGGQVALLAGALSKRIKAIVAYYPVTDIQRWGATTSHSGIRDSYVPRVCEPGGHWRSPVNVASKIEAAVLLIHGDQDTRVPTEQSLRMQEALRKANRQVDMQLIGGAAHGFTSSQDAQAWPLALKFFATHLGERTTGR
jgi:dipeptidyl aminopeptidase/acylaminoacyl peptidase